MIKQPQILIIDWADAYDNPGWRSQDDLNPEPLKCQTIGFVVERTKDSITIASNRSQTEGYRLFGNLVTIPLGCIKKKRIVK